MSRISRIQSNLPKDAIFLVSNPINIRYLCGFTGSNGLLLLKANQATLYTDFRYEIQASQELVDSDCKVVQDIWNAVKADLDCQIVLVEENHITFAQFENLKINHNSISFQNSKNLVENARLTKDEAEISAISQACEISTAALSSLISIKLIGKSELEVATILDRTMVDLGATGPAFETIVATGSNSAIPHHQPTDRLLAKGDLLKIDFGAQVGCYKSDCTRTFALGKPADWQEEIYRAVVVAQEIGRKTCVPDLDFGSLDNAVRQSISDSGYGDKFKHGLGHGVGLMIHEDPFLSAKTDGKIAQNMVITIEPGIYLPDLGGVRVEDTGLVTNAGYSVLTNFTYDLLELN